MYVIARTEKEIDRVRKWADEGEDQDFELGVQAALAWLFGEQEEAPDGE